MFSIPKAPLAVLQKRFTATHRGARLYTDRLALTAKGTIGVIVGYSRSRIAWFAFDLPADHAIPAGGVLLPPDAVNHGLRTAKGGAGVHVDTEGGDWAMGGFLFTPDPASLAPDYGRLVPCTDLFPGPAPALGAADAAAFAALAKAIGAKKSDTAPVIFRPGANEGDPAAVVFPRGKFAPDVIGALGAVMPLRADADASRPFWL